MYLANFYVVDSLSLSDLRRTVQSVGSCLLLNVFS